MQRLKHKLDKFYIKEVLQETPKGLSRKQFKKMYYGDVHGCGFEPESKEARRQYFKREAKQ